MNVIVNLPERITAMDAIVDLLDAELEVCASDMGAVTLLRDARTLARRLRERHLSDLHDMERPRPQAAKVGMATDPFFVGAWEAITSLRLRHEQRAHQPPPPGA